MDELLVFDLDGTLIDADERISDITRRALHQLDQGGIAWTIATGRLPQGAREALPEVRFKHPQAYKNGVLIWDLNDDRSIHTQPLDRDEFLEVCKRLDAHGINAMANVLHADNRIGAAVRDSDNEREQSWVRYMESQALNIQRHNDFARVEGTVFNIFALTENERVLYMAEELADIPGIQVYAGSDMYHHGYYWLDIHHVEGTKGDAVKYLQQQTGAKKLICFGDSDNDIAMFECADEAYAMENALPELKAIATQTIGKNTDHAIAYFLADRYGFSL